MKMKSISEALGGNAYPGRGIILGKSEDGNNAAIAYFIMGRSENSRNRVFVEDGRGLRTKAFDESKVKDPSLIIYSPVRVLDGAVIVTNGDQTDTIYESLMRGETFEDALRKRTFEPDAPNFTPRISGLAELGGKFGYRLSILKSAGGNPASAERFFYEYADPVNGEGRLLHTYSGDGDPLPSFEGEPTAVSVPSDVDAFTREIWESLNADNRVSLFTRYVSLKTGLSETRIVNKNQ